MIKEIVRPEFGYIVDHVAFSTWFDLHVEPNNTLIREAVNVIAWQTLGAEKDWIAEENETGLPDHFKRYRALLIGIEPIKQESCADVLRELVRWEPAWEETRYSPMVKSLKERAKAALERDSEPNN